MGFRLLGKGRHRVASTIARDGRFDLETSSWIEWYGGRGGMSKSGVDVDLNSVQRHESAPKEVLKEAMLHHEIVFRNQVLELHRLYWTQKNLMNAMWTTNSEMTSTLARGVVPSEQCESNSPNFHLVQQRSVNLELPVNEYIKVAANDCLEIRSFTNNEIVDLSNPGNVELTLGSSREDNDEKSLAKRTLSYKESHLFNQVAINLENDVELVSNKEVNAISQFNFKIPKTDSRATYGSQLPVPSDITSSGRTRKESGCTFSSNHSHIDLSEGLREQRSFHFDLGCGEIKGHSSVDIFTRNKKSGSHKAKNFNLNMTQLQEYSDDSDNDSVMIPPSASSSAVFVGVLDEFHDDTLPDNICWRETSDKCSKQTLVALKVNTAHRTSTNSCGNEADLLFYGNHVSHPCCRQFSANGSKFARGDWNNDQNEVNYVVLWSNSENQGNIERKSNGGFYGNFDLEVQSRLNGSSLLSPSGFYKSGDKDADLSLGQPNLFVMSDRNVSSTLDTNIEENNLFLSSESTNATRMLSGDLEPKQASYDRSEASSAWGDHVSAQGTMFGAEEENQDGHCQETPNGDKPAIRTGNNTSRVGVEDVEKCVVLSINEDFLTNQMGLLVTQTNCIKQDAIANTQDRVYLEEKLCSYGQLQPPEHVGANEQRMAETDCRIQRAAETLVCISLVSSASSIDRFANIGQIEPEADERSEQPQYSSESFEEIVLMLKESVNDEYSKPDRSTGEETAKKSCKFKLRRGRGLCDFQKDVLPGLVSLSRHEICEDLHIIGEAVRMHELMGAGKLHKGNWFTPVRGRRSRLNCIGRMQ